MTIRSILVPINAHPADKSVLEAAYTLGKAFAAHISVACIRPDPTEVLRYANDWSSPMVLDSAVAAAEQHSHSVAHRSQAMFERWRGSHQLPLGVMPDAESHVSTAWSDHVGASGFVLSDIARFSDLVMMRTLGDKGPIDGDLMLEAVLFDAGRPLLLTPRQPVDILAGTALIAWDGGREALRAVVAAVPIMARMRAVRILTVESDVGVNAEALAAYLAWHGVAAEVSDVVRGTKSIGDIVMREAQRARASLLIMGGYHHGRTRELLFGGTTRRIISATKVPVLLAH